MSAIRGEHEKKENVDSTVLYDSKKIPTLIHKIWLEFKYSVENSRLCSLVWPPLLALRALKLGVM